MYHTPYSALGLHSTLNGSRWSLLHPMEVKELEFTVSDATVYDAVSRIEAHGTFASRANQVLEGVKISTEQMGDLVSTTAELLDKVKAFTDLVDNIASVSTICQWIQKYC